MAPDTTLPRTFNRFWRPGSTSERTEPKRRRVKRPRVAIQSTNSMASVRALTKEDYDQVATLIRELSAMHTELHRLKGTRGRYSDQSSHNHLRKYV